MSFLQGITIFCFAASYGVALALELVHLVRPGAVERIVTLGFAAAGLLAHTLFLLNHGQSYGGQPLSLLFLSWVLAIFYFYGSIHHRRQAWGVFVLPVVLGLVVAAQWLPDSGPAGEAAAGIAERLWWLVDLHVALLILGAVGVCVGFVASVMYLAQSRKLKHKMPSSLGLPMLSLEKLEEMNRRAINWAFPLFTGGLLTGLFLWNNQKLEWLDPKVISTAVLWLAFVVLLYLRYGLHLRGRRVAIGTIAAFFILLVAFAVHRFLPSSHHFGGGS